MAGSLALHLVTYKDYLQVEEDSKLLRHEFLDGEIYPMAGGTAEHGAIGANVIALLSVQLRGRGCRVHSSDVRIRVLATGLATYPDVSVVGSRAEFDPDDRNAIVNPVVIVEVLSPGTAVYDGGEKLLEIWRRAANGVWASVEVGAVSAVLESVGAVLGIDDVYRDELAG